MMRLFWRLTVLCTIVLWADAALAQRRPIADETLGEERSIVTPEDNLRGLPGDRIEGGARRGDNLFHSFQEFNIDAGRAVYFDDPSVINILSRVTGGTVSEILGRLGVLGDANLFLINPSGIIFGEGASLDVGGSFVATSADAIQFGDQGFFNASDPNAPPLLTVQPSAFLFNQLNPGAIENNSIAFAGVSPSGSNVFGLRVPDGQSLLLVGGNVILDGEEFGGRLNAFGGRVELGGLSESGSVLLNADGSLGFPVGVGRSDVLLSNGAFIDVAAGGGGSVTINAQNINILDGSVLRAGIFSGLGTVGSQSGNIVLNGTGEIQVGPLSLIVNNVEANGIGNSGNIDITAGSLFVTDGAQLQALTYGQGDAGDVIINADDRVLFDDGDAISRVEEDGIGIGGNINIDTGSLEVRNGAQLVAITEGQGDAGSVIINADDRVVFDGIGANGLSSAAFSTVGSVGFNGEAVGEGGDVRITTGSLEVINGAQLLASTFGQGDAGDVIINADDRVVFDGIGANRLPSAAFSTVGLRNFTGMAVGNGGNVRITTGSLQVSNGAQLQASTFRQGDAGDVIIDADDWVLFDDGNAFSTVGLRNFTGMAVGNGGNIQIRAGSLEVSNGAQLLASTFGQGDAGDVMINADDRVLFDDGNAFSTVGAVNFEGMAVGNGGDVQIRTSSLEVIRGAQIQASTFGQGSAGNVMINSDNRVVFDGLGANGRASAAISTVGLRNFTGMAVGNGGNVQIRTGSLEVLNGAQLVASTFEQGDAGDVMINADDRVVFDGTSADGVLSSAAFSNVEEGAIGRGGNISIDTNSLIVRNGAQLVTGINGQGNAGSVIIGADDRVVFDGTSADGELPSAAFSNVGQSGIGRGGNIVINTASLVVRNGARLDASTYGQGNAGNVTVNARDEAVFDGANADERSSSVAWSRVGRSGIGRGGNIVINTASLVVRNGAQLATSTYGQGNAGSVIIDADDRVVFDGTSADGVLSSAAFSNVEEGAIGRGGNISIDTNSLIVRNGAQLVTGINGQGNAGSVIIGADDRVVFDGTSADGELPSAAISRVEEGGIGSGGNVVIDTGSLVVRNGAQLIANTRGQGVAGSVIIDADDRVSIEGIGSSGLSSALFTSTSIDAQGQGGAITINANSVRLTDGAVINAETENAFRGGDVTINADTFEVTGGGQVITTTSGGGRAGNITLNVTDRITLSGFDPDYADRPTQRVSNQGETSGLFANTAEGSSGRGGTIRITAGELDISDRAGIVVNSQGSGVAGDIDITAQSIELDRGRLTAETNTVEGGSIAIATDSLSLTDGAQISVDGTDSAGEAGDIEVQARNIELDEASQITAETASGQGGDITLRDVDLLLLRNGSNISTTAGTRQAGGDGGNITIDADFIVAFPNENSDISANAFSGSGGRIDITTEGLFGIEERDPPTEFSDITASSELGVQGEININTPDVDPSRGITELPAEVVDASDQIAQTCPTDGNVEELGEFIVTGRGGLPANPAELLGGETVLSKLAEVEGEGDEGDGGDGEVERDDRPATVETNPADIVEAQGWVVGADGKVILTAGNPAVEPYSPATVPVHCAHR